MIKKILIIAVIYLIALHVFADEKYNITIINDGIKYDMTDVRFCILTGKGLYAMIGSSLIGIDIERNGDITEFTLPDSTFFIDEVVLLPSIFVFKSDSNILHLNTHKRLRGFSIDTDNFHIRYATDTTIYILVGDKVFESNPYRGEPKLKFEYTNHKIIEYLPVRNETYIATENQLLLKNKYQLALLLNMPEPITTINISSHGILIGTKSALYKYNSIGTLELIDEVGVSQILNDGDYLYIITENSSIYRLQRLPNESTKAKVKSKNR